MAGIFRWLLIGALVGVSLGASRGGFSEGAHIVVIGITILAGAIGGTLLAALAWGIVRMLPTKGRPSAHNSAGQVDLSSWTTRIRVGIAVMIAIVAGYFLRDPGFTEELFLRQVAYVEGELPDRLGSHVTSKGNSFDLAPDGTIDVIYELSFANGKYEKDIISETQDFIIDQMCGNYDILRMTLLGFKYNFQFVNIDNRPLKSFVVGVCWS